MKVSSDVRWLRINGIQKESLVSLFKSGNPTKTDLTRSSWKSLIESSSLQSNCKLQGFNLKTGPSTIFLRIGYLANQENNCDSCDSFIGIGPTDRFSISCGNQADGESSDDGYEENPAMCYVLIQ